MNVGVPKETFPGERRVAVIPAHVSALTKAGVFVQIQRGAGIEAGYGDEAYGESGAHVVETREELISSSEIVLQVRAAGANPEAGKEDLTRLKEGQFLIGLLNPFGSAESFTQLIERKVTSFALELIPRITRAQSMDVLSAMANIAGYKAVLMAGDKLTKMFPMMMTAAGTIIPARVFVVGAGVAGLQAIATAQRLGAVVQGYDIRPAVKEQVESLGAKFVELKLDTEETESSGGYAKQMNDDFYNKQRELMSAVVADSDVVICTAAVPGKKAPVLITATMLKNMAPGSVVVDLAAESGGNCELTVPAKTVLKHGITIAGPINLPSTVPYHASQLYSKNITTFLLFLLKDGTVEINREDEITSETLVTLDGCMVHQTVKEKLKL